jgi:hypothetical protein
MVKISGFSAREGVMVPQRTLHRHCEQRTTYRGRSGTVPVVESTANPVWSARAATRLSEGPS